MAPTIGPPIGVDPITATVHSAMTRPRIRGSAASCSVLLPLDMQPTLVAPTNSSATSSSSRVGAKAAARMAAPNAIEELTRERTPTRPRAAIHSPPPTAPTPIAAVMKPKAWARPLKVSLAMMGSTTWNS